VIFVLKIPQNKNMKSFNCPCSIYHISQYLRSITLHENKIIKIWRRAFRHACYWFSNTTCGSMKFDKNESDLKRETVDKKNANDCIKRFLNLGSISTRWQANNSLIIRAVIVAKGFIAVCAQRTVTRFVTVV